MAKSSDPFQNGGCLSFGEFISDDIQGINCKELKLWIRVFISKLKLKLKYQTIKNNHFKMVASLISADFLVSRQLKGRSVFFSNKLKFCRPIQTDIIKI